VFSLDHSKYEILAHEKAEKFADSRPFPNLLLEDFIPGPVCTRMSDLHPRPPLIGYPSNVGSLAASCGAQEGARGRILSTFGSEGMAKFVSALAGCDGPNLKADPTWLESGFVTMTRNSTMSVSNYCFPHPNLHWRKRLVFLACIHCPTVGPENRQYMNPGIFLWSHRDGEGERRWIELEPGQGLVLELGPKNFWGMPLPLDCDQSECLELLRIFFYKEPKEES